jgi:hypothetical protein
MIPRSTYNGDSIGNGVRYRVSACRKRLRFSRSIHRTHANIQQDEQAREIETHPAPGCETTGVLLGTSGAQEEAEST